MAIACVEHVEDDNESHFVREREIVSHRYVNVFLDVDATVAEPPNAARVRLKLLILSINDGILFTGRQKVSVVG